MKCALCIIFSFAIVLSFDAYSKSCDIEVGKSKLVKKKLSGYTEIYDLRRVSSEDYRISINLRFKKDTSTKELAGVEEEMLSKLNSCLRKVNKKLTDYRGLRLFIDTDNKMRSTTKKVTLYVNDYTAREYIYWTPDYSCPDLIHELFHFLSLEDEYLSKSYSCRAVSPKDSIMYDPYLAFRVTGIKLTLDDYYWYVNSNCVRDRSREHCPTYFKKFKKSLEKFKLKGERLSYRKLPKKLEGEILRSFNKILSKKFKTRKSLLYPKQLDFLIHEPECNNNSRVYGECANNAQKNRNCFNVSSVCKAYNWLDSL